MSTDAHRAEMHATGFTALLEIGTADLGLPAMHELLASLGVSELELQDPNAWFSLSLAEGIIRELESRTGDTKLLDRVATTMLSPKHLGLLYPLVRALGTPAFTYSQMVNIAKRLNKVATMEVERLARCRIQLRYRTSDGAPHESGTFMCRARRAQFAALPTIFDLAPAQVEHPACMQLGDAACIYDVRWQEPRPQRLSRWSLIVGGILSFFAAESAHFGIWASLCIAVGVAAGAWGIARVTELRRELADRLRDVDAHREALTDSARSHEQRFEELLQAKAEVDQKVEQRTAELREASLRLSASFEEIRALDRAKTDFFNNVSHELRSPLTLILAPLQDVVDGRVPPGGNELAFQTMHRNASRLLRLINQLLDLAKIDAGQMQIAPVPTAVTSLLRTCISAFEAAAQTKGVRLELHLPVAMAPVLLDPAWIESAVTNLIANALRLTRAGGSIRVTAEDLGGEARITVADDGPGISAADHEKVFERFAQGDSSKRVIGGTGIGLALVREAARLHMGDVKLISELGKGSSFVLTLPRRSDTRDTISGPVLSGSPRAAVSLRPIAAVEDADQELTRAGPSADAPLALVVEDNAELRVFIADVLAADYRVRTASNGRQGLARALQLKPDVIITDVAMPEMDGFELCRALRAEDKTRATPILLVTARTDIASVLQGFAAGASDYVLKPFHGRELLARVDVHVRLRRMVEEFALRERHAALGVLAASVAHQVRNPLTTLMSGLPAMNARLSKTLDSSTKQLIGVMIDCAGRIERMTADLMDLSRVDREVGGPFRPSDGLRAAVRLIGARLPPGVQVQEQVEDCPVTHGRPGDLNHVFLNLLDNAAKAVADNGTIQVSARCEQTMYVVDVGDSGPGVDEETARRVFEAFFTTRQAGEGTGLGLAIAQQVMLQCGGKIVLGRSPLGGAMFSVYYPLDAAMSERPRVAAGG